MSDNDYCLICGKSFNYCSKSKICPNYCNECTEKRISQNKSLINTAETKYKIKIKKQSKEKSNNLITRNFTHQFNKICVHCDKKIETTFLGFDSKTVLCIGCFNKSFPWSKRCLNCASQIAKKRLDINPNATRCTECEAEHENQIKRLRL